MRPKLFGLDKNIKAKNNAYLMKYKFCIFLIYIFLAGVILSPLSPGQLQAQETSDTCSLPPADILGEDVTGFPRYPNSVRTQFSRETEKNVILLNQQAIGMEVTYRANDEMSHILDFYNRETKSQNWELTSSKYLTNFSIYMTFSQGEQRILLSLRPNSSAIAPAFVANNSDKNSQTAINQNCYIIQIFSWNEKDSKPLERRSRFNDTSRAMPGRAGR